MRKFAILAMLALYLVGVLPLSAQWRAEFTTPGGAEEFRLGVEAYQKGRFSEAILLLEKALAFEGRQELASYWLGRAYLKSGYVATALRVWSSLAAQASAPPFLRSKIEGLEGSQNLSPGGGETNFIEIARFEGSRGKTVYFSRPSAILPRSDGSLYVVAQGTNEVLLLDPNGVIRERQKGGFQGLDRPFGIASLPDGSLFVTEFNGDRISRMGSAKALTFGSKGRGEGQLLGPQYVACDDQGYLYVCDYGNARIVKFDPEGNYVLSFGGPSGSFPGFVGPGGIVIQDGSLFAADSFRKAIYTFDLSGNYIATLGEGLLHYPEGLSLWRQGRDLLVADTDRIVSLNIETETATVVYQSPDRKARIVGAVADRNGGILACDFDASAVLVLAGPGQLAAGLDVEIERVMADAFPRVDVDVTVRDRSGNPVIGLDLPNFHLSERIVTKTSTKEKGVEVEKKTETLSPVGGYEFLGSAEGPSPVRLVFLVDPSTDMVSQRSAFRKALAEIMGGFPPASPPVFSLVTMGAVPSLDAKPGSGLAEISKVAIAQARKGGRLDLGIRFAATGLLPTGPRDAIVYMGTGRIDPQAFGATTISELSSFLRNNGIRLYGIIFGEDPVDDSLRYLTEQSGGGLYAASRPQGLGEVPKAIAQVPSGRYRLRFLSKADSGFGESYLGLSVEAYLYKKSGRDEAGYFGPRK